MRIRFLRVVDSATPGYPFVPGQVIDVASPTPDLLALLNPHADGSIRAEVVRDETDDIADDLMPEVAIVRAERPRKRARG